LFKRRAAAPSQVATVAKLAQSRPADILLRVRFVAGWGRLPAALTESWSTGDSVHVASRPHIEQHHSSLTTCEPAFVAAFLVRKKATRAAIEAGYSRKTAAVIGCRLLKKVQIADEIAERTKQNLDAKQMDARRVLHLLTERVEFDIAECFDQQ